MGMVKYYLDMWEGNIKHPNKGHTLKNGQRPMYQSVCHSESHLYVRTCMLFVVQPN